RLLQSKEAGNVLLALEMFQKMGIKLSATEMADAMDRVKAHDPAWLIETVKRETTGAAWAVAALVEILAEGGEEWPVARICDALFLIGPAAEPAIPVLIKTLDHKGPGAQRYAARTLGVFGAKSKKALPKLRKLHEEAKDAQVRQWVSAAIKAIERGQ
ncbi:HEAT repeat domain-containing protein, partial [Verrucomicrobiota bacterium]